MEQTVFTLAIALIVAIVSLAASTKSAKAASEPAVRPGWAAWAFEATPSNGEIDAVWTITIGGEDKQGDSIVLHQEQIPLDCKLFGDVGVKNNEISFKGGHIECQFPGLIDTANGIIRDLWGRQYELSIGPDCGCMPLVSPYAPFAEIDAAVDSKGANPIFFHPSIAVALPSTGHEIANELSFSSRTSTSPEISASGLRNYRSTYGCDPRHGSCLFEHFQNGAMIGQEKLTHSAVSFYTGSVTVLIGKPSTGSDRFQGSIQRIHIDPGCRGI